MQRFQLNSVKKVRISLLAAGFLMAILFTSVGAPTAFVASSPLELYHLPESPNSSISRGLSQNWAGYVSDTGTYTSVTGSWTVPSVPTASGSAEADATWVGIGGVKDKDLIQAGTQTITENGLIQYEAWYETLPDASTPVSLTVNPGDSITTTITETSTNEWLVTIRDNTTGNMYSNTVNYASTNSSAEWIEEMPSDTSGNFVPLDNFGSVSFSNAAASITPNTELADAVQENLVSLGAYSLIMSTQAYDYAQYELATPSALGADDESFTVTRTAQSSEVTPQTVQIQRGGFRRGGEGIQGFAGFSPAFDLPGQSGNSLAEQISQLEQELGSGIPIDPGTQIDPAIFSSNPGAYTATSSTYTLGNGQIVHVVQYQIQF